MLDFFKKIIPNFSNKKGSEKLNADSIKLYLDRKKKSFIPIKIKPESTCQEIHSNYHSEILSDISQLYSASVYNNLSVNQISKTFNSKDYNFIIIDDENRFIEIKMKEIDCPLKYMVKPSINLYYLNIGKEQRKDSLDSELNSYSINSVGKNRKQTDNATKLGNVLDTTQNNIIDNNEESIREGDLMKFSNKKKTFEKRKVIIDKKKLIIEKKSKNDATILLLRDVKQIMKNSINPDIDSRERFVFEITTLEGEKYTFKSKNNSDLNSWLETIETHVNLIRDNELILYFEENIKKEIKGINDKAKQILIDCLSLRGILSINETRHIFFKFFDNPLITNLVEMIINYKFNVKQFKYKDALLTFKSIIGYLDIENIDVNCFQNQLHFDYSSVHGERKRSDLISTDKGSSSRRKYLLGEIKSRNIIFDRSNTYNIENGLVLNNYENNSINIDPNLIALKEEMFTGSNLNRGNKYYSNSSSYNKILMEENKLVMEKSSNSNPNLMENESEKDDKTTLAKGVKDACLKILKINEVLSSSDENIGYSKDLISPSDFPEKKAKLLNILKFIMTIDIITNLKILKNDLKEYFDKYHIDIFGKSNELDFSDISTQEQNLKFSEFLKIGIFNDIYENILSRYFNDFYKSIFNDKNFLSSLEKILVHYFKINNQLLDPNSKIIDFNDIIKMYSQKQ